ncbi:MAG: hypothetical protein KL863_11320 [Rhizobium sp.]|nr:hypothetical protein [Rhizobium sp.]
MRTLSGLFDTRSDAAQAIDDLMERGVPRHDISIVSNDSAGWYAEDSKEEAGAETGAGIGALAGGAGGLLAGLGVLAIPGIGELVAAGWLLSTLAGATAGAIVGGATGGLVALLMDHGIDERDAHVFAEGLKRGGTLVTARVPDQLAVAAEAIFLKHSVDIAARRDDLAAEGWTRFDDHVPSSLNRKSKVLEPEKKP